MTTTKLGRATFSLSAALTTAAMVAAPAMAAATAPDVYSGAARANALEIDIIAPAEILGLLGMDSLELGVSLTDVTTTSEGLSSAAVDLLRTPLLNEGASSASGESNGVAGIIEPTTIGPVSIGVGNYSYNIDDVTNTVTSASELAHINVSLAGLIPAAPAVDDVVNTVTTEVEALVGDIVGELNGVLGTLEQTLEDTAGLPIDIPEVPLADVLQDVLASDLDTTILDIRKIWSDSTVGTVDGVMRSTANAGIVGANILDGAILIPEFSYSAWALAGGAPGTADAGFSAGTLKLEVLGQEIISLDGGELTVGGVTLDLQDPAFAGLPVADTMDPITDLVNELLNVAGIDYSLGEGVTEISPDGTFASSKVSAFSISVAPLHAATAIPELASVISSVAGDADDLLRIDIRLLPVTAEARAARAIVAPLTVSNEPSLPRTGGGAAAALFGLMGIGSAAVLRRRF